MSLKGDHFHNADKFVDKNTVHWVVHENGDQTVPCRNRYLEEQLGRVSGVGQNEVKGFHQLDSHRSQIPLEGLGLNFHRDRFLVVIQGFYDFLAQKIEVLLGQSNNFGPYGDQFDILKNEIDNFSGNVGTVFKRGGLVEFQLEQVVFHNISKHFFFIVLDDCVQ